MHLYGKNRSPRGRILNPSLEPPSIPPDAGRIQMDGPCATRMILFLMALVQPLYAMAVSGDLSCDAKNAIPDALSRMHSPDPVVRWSLIEELVVTELDWDVLRYSLHYALTDDDYSIILRNALPGLANQLPDETKRGLLSKVQHISRMCSLTGVDAGVAEFAQGQPDGLTRFALRMLVEMNSRLATPHLLWRLRSQDPSNAYAVLQDLVAVRAVEATPEISELLALPNDTTRHWAVWALYSLDAKEYREAIYTSCVHAWNWGDTDPYVLAVLTKWDEPRAVPLVMRWLTADSICRRSTMGSRLVEIGAGQIDEPIISFLEAGRGPDGDEEAHANRNVEADAMRLLRRLGSRKAVPVLITFTAGDDEYLACVAAEQLGIVGGEEAIPVLLSMLRREGYSPWCTATLALARIGNPMTARTVVDELRRREPDLHTVQVLGTLGRVSAPETYQRLKRTRIPTIPPLPFGDYFGQVGEHVGISVRMSARITTQRMQGILGGRVDDTGLSALERGLQMLNYSGNAHVVFLEEKCIHVLPIGEAYETWDNWLDSHAQRCP